MRPTLMRWCLHHGLPAGLVPRYFELAGLSALLAAVLILRQARRDGEPVVREARLLAVMYGSALLGGYVFEALRALPVALVQRSPGHLLAVGRAAYGGLLAAILVAAIGCRMARRPLGAFLDRCAVPAGLVFALVRTGCFLEGCDYGRPTALPWGLRFPGGSLAAMHHARQGWVVRGAPSLPVHATQLYEAALGLAAALVAWRVLSLRRRDGNAFLAWLGTYALGRFLIEFLRGDAGRGSCCGLSTAQLVSVGLLLAMAGLAWHRRTRARPRLAALAAGAALLLVAAGAGAQPVPPRPVSLGIDEGPGSPAEARPPTASQARDPRHEPRYFRLRSALVVSVPIDRRTVPLGVAIEVQGLARFGLGGPIGLGVGVEARYLDNAEAGHLTFGMPVSVFFALGTRLEMHLTMVPHFTWIGFASHFVEDATAFGFRTELGLTFLVSSRISLGLSPVAINYLGAEAIGSIASWEPRAWFGLAL